jgi:hypothetical protein
MISFSSLKVRDFLSINGIEQNVLKVHNDTGAPLTKGTLVYINGYDAALDQYTVAKADADAGLSADLVLLEAIAANASGRAAQEALVNGMNTAAANVGDPVYLSNTAGGFQLAAPAGADQIVQQVGTVKVKNAAGTIRFYPGKMKILAWGTSGLQTSSITRTKLAGGFSKVSLIAGGLAGDHNIAGMALGDELVFVGHISTAASVATIADLTSEFTVAAGKITNTLGTDTSDDQLLVIWNDLT